VPPLAGAAPEAGLLLPLLLLHAAATRASAAAPASTMPPGPGLNLRRRARGGISEWSIT